MTNRPLLFRCFLASLVCSVLSGAARADSTAQAPVVCTQDAHCFEQLKRALAQAKTNRAAALATLENAYRAYPDPRLCYNLGRLLHQLDRPAEAIVQYRLFLESGVENRPEILIKARTYLEKLEREADIPAPSARESAEPQKTDIPPQSLPDSAASPKPDNAPPIAPVPIAPSPTPLTPAAAIPEKEKPLYKKWWLWTIVGVGGAGAALGLGFGLAARRPDVTGAAIVRPYGG